MPLASFPSAREHAAIRSAVLESIGRQLRSAYAADLEAPITGPLAECLRRIDERASRTHKQLIRITPPITGG